MQLLRLSTFFSILFIFLFSCQEDSFQPEKEDSELESEDIQINDSSIFNMSKFIEGLDRIIAQEYLYNHSHILENEVLISTSYDYFRHGKFGKGLGNWTHTYNDSGVIDFSTFNYYHLPDISTKKKYEFDSEGNIVGTSIYKEDELLSKYKYTYGQNGNIIVEEHFDKNNELISTRENSYNDNDFLIDYSVKKDDSNESYFFEYDENNVIKYTRKRVSSNGDYEDVFYYKYDNENRLIEMTSSIDPTTRTFEYYSEYLLQTNFGLQNEVLETSEIGYYFQKLNSKIYDYNQNEEFQGLTELEYEGGIAKKGSYYSGDNPDNLILLGYGIMYFSNEGEREKFEVYNDVEELLFTKDLNDEWNIWYDGDGNLIEYVQLPEWVKEIYSAL